MIFFIVKLFVFKNLFSDMSQDLHLLIHLKFPNRILQLLSVSPDPLKKKKKLDWVSLKLTEHVLFSYDGFPKFQSISLIRSWSGRGRV